MKRRVTPRFGSLLTSLSLLCSSSAFVAQQVDWAKNIPGPATSKGLLTDPTGNIYHYGSQLIVRANWNYLNIVDYLSSAPGSFLNKYDAAGNLLSTKTWSGSFRLSQLIFHAGAFYFTGVFSGTEKFGKAYLTSKGKLDGVFGKMDLAGNIFWASSFGGTANDLGLGITTNLVGDKIVVTGGLSDSLFLNGTLHTPQTQKTMLLASFDLSGKPSSILCMDFDTSHDFGNCGMEIRTDPQGNYIVFGKKDGNKISLDSVVPDVTGYYVLKFDASFNSLWQSFLINEASYYGYSCGALSVNAAGDAFASIFGSHKYGGYGSVVRINGANGHRTWTSPLNSDGSYHHTYCDGNQLFIIGEEGASDCPCEGNHPGYMVIKKFDQYNQLVGEARFKGPVPVHIIKSSNGQMYTTGYFGGDSTFVGADKLFHSNSPYFISSLTDINCAPVKLDELDYHWRPYLFCDTVTLDAGDSYLEYLWTDGSTNRYLKATSDGTYRVRVKQHNTCLAWSTGTIVKKRNVPSNPNIYSVSYDNYSGKYKVQWSSWYSSNYDGKFSSILWRAYANGEIRADTINNSSYITEDSDLADAGPPQYSLQFFDDCGNVSNNSNIHQPIHLNVTGNNGGKQLNWTPYIGVPVQFYQILRGTHLWDLKPYSTFASTVSSFTDTDPGVNYLYQVAANGYILSNPASELPLGVEDNDDQFTNTISVYPNPADGEFFIEFDQDQKDVIVSVTTTLGVQLREYLFSDPLKKIVVDLTGEESGLYLLQIRTGGKQAVKKVLVKR